MTYQMGLNRVKILKLKCCYTKQVLYRVIELILIGGFDIVTPSVVLGYVLHNCALNRRAETATLDLRDGHREEIPEPRECGYFCIWFLEENWHSERFILCSDDKVLALQPRSGSQHTAVALWVTCV